MVGVKEGGWSDGMWLRRQCVFGVVHVVVVID